MITRTGITTLLCFVSFAANADCVEGALTMNRFSRVNSHTVALTGGYDGAIVIRTACRIKRSSTVEVLKDSFCNEATDVLVIDGKNCDVEQVSRDDRFNEDRLWDEDDSWDDKID